MRKASPKPDQQSSKAVPSRVSSRRERQIVRILSLLRVLAQGATPSVHELAARFGTRRETIYRDLRVLQDAGYPIAGDDQGRLSRPRLLSAKVPEVGFSKPELDALLLAISQAEVALPDSKSLASATSKLSALACAERHAGSLGLCDVFETWTCGSTSYRDLETRVSQIVEAILRQLRCRVEYRRPSRSEPKTYDFDPYRLLFVGGALYVVGRVPKHSGTATLAIGRLQSVVLSQIEFEVDPTFDPQKCRLDAFGISWEDPQDIVLRFRADQAHYVRERIWHPSQKISDLPDGDINLAFRAGGHFEIRRWSLGWGDAVEVISPDNLRSDLQNTLRRATTLYQSQSEVSVNV